MTVLCDHGVAIDHWCSDCEWLFIDSETGEELRVPEPQPTSRAGWLIPLILIAVAVAAVAWRLR